MRFSIVLSLLVPCLATAQQAWTLDQCVRRAEEKNLNVRNAALDAELADQAKRQSAYNLLPNLNAFGTHGYNWGKAIDRFTNTFATDRVRTNNFYLSSQVSLFEGFSKQNQLGQARIDAESSAKGLEDRRNDVRLSTVQAFIDVLSLRERIAATGKQVANISEQITITQALVDGGRLARSEVLDQRSQLAQQEYNLVDLRNQHDRRILDLMQQLQLSPEEQRGFDIVSPAISAMAISEPAQDPQDVLRAVLAANPGYQQRELQATSAEKGVSISRAGMMPSLRLEGAMGTGYSGRNLEAVGEPVLGTPQLIGFTQGGEEVYTPTFSQETRTRAFGSQLDDNLNESVTLSLAIPLFNNQSNRIAVSQARIRHEQAKNAVEAERQSLEREVQQAITAQRGAYRQYEAAQRSLEAANESFRLAQERFTAGAATSLDLNTARTNVDRATADTITAKYTYVMAAKYLEILQGLPLSF
ncbi:MAG: TolC family protein [Flavobacteriales bacterium]|nr:MAG: TolC family protein [Flavobacteriales bacterium]